MRRRGFFWLLECHIVNQEMRLENLGCIDRHPFLRHWSVSRVLYIHPHLVGLDLPVLDAQAYPVQNLWVFLQLRTKLESANLPGVCGGE